MFSAPVSLSVSVISVIEVHPNKANNMDFSLKHLVPKYFKIITRGAMIYMGERKRGFLVAKLLYKR